MPPKFEGSYNKNRERARQVLKKMTEDGFSYPAAVRQVLVNERVTHEPDVQRLMKELSALVDAERERMLDEQEILAELREERIQEERKRTEEDLRRVQEERGGDPED